MTLVPRSIAKLSSHRLLRGSSKGAEEEGGRHPERKLGGASSGCVSGGFGLDDGVVHTALGVCLVQTGLCGDKLRKPGPRQPIQHCHGNQRSKASG